MVHFVEQCFDSPSLISDKCCHLTLYLSQMEPYCERIILAAWSFEQRWSGSWNFFYFLLKLWLFFDAQALPHYFLCPRPSCFMQTLPSWWSNCLTLSFFTVPRSIPDQRNSADQQVADVAEGLHQEPSPVGSQHRWVGELSVFGFYPKNPLSGSLLITVWNFDRCRTSMALTVVIMRSRELGRWPAWGCCFSSVLWNMMKKVT